MFFEQFSEILQDRELTAYQVAKNTGISQGLMNEYKNGIKLPTINNLLKISEFLDVSVDFLLGKTEINTTLTADELHLLNIYRNISERGQIWLMEAAEGAAIRYKKDNISAYEKKIAN